MFLCLAFFSIHPYQVCVLPSADAFAGSEGVHVRRKMLPLHQAAAVLWLPS